MVYDVHYFFEIENTDVDWAAWGAVLISILALGVTFWQAHLARRHNKLSVRPYLAGHTSCSDTTYSLEIRNDGLGPALLTAVRVYRDGKLIEGEGTQLVDNAFSGVPGCKLEGREFFYPVFVLPAGQSINVFTVKYDPAIDDIELYLASRLCLEIEYKSSYEEPCPKYTTRKIPQN